MTLRAPTDVELRVVVSVEPCRARSWRPVIHLWIRGEPAPPIRGRPEPSLWEAERIARKVASRSGARFRPWNGKP